MKTHNFSRSFAQKETPETYCVRLGENVALAITHRLGKATHDLQMALPGKCIMIWKPFNRTISQKKILGGF